MKIALVLFLCGLTFSALAQADMTSINGVLNSGPSDSQYEQQLQIARMRQKLLEQQQIKAAGLSPVNKIVGKLRLDQFSHALDVQLVDKLSSFSLFSIVEDKDLRDALNSPVAGVTNSLGANRSKLAIVNVNAVPTLMDRYGLPPPTNSEFDLKNPDTVTQFKNVGINYLLVTTLEDLDENHLDGATVSRSYEYVNGHKTGWWVEDSGENYKGYSIQSGVEQSSSSWKRETVGVSPQLKKEQSLRVTVRSRIYNAQTGELLGSNNKTYARGRSYMASVRGNNELSMGDLYQTAAEDLANWERIIVEDNVFPIKVLKIEDNEVLLNRGSDSAIQLNTYYDVWLKGEAIKDSDNGSILGYEDQKVGEVLIRELQPHFSRAMVSQDQGIKVGAILRLKP
jgi:hypothetical protein